MITEWSIKKADGRGEIRISVIRSARKSLGLQGVGFRYTAKYLAQSLGLTGWVRNEYDGTVLLEIQGSEYMINKLLMGLNHNQFITIEWMDTEELPLDKEEKSFSVR